jgi:uncharacterized membrane protein (DUF485 family)
LNSNERALLQSTEFRQLVKRRWRLSLILTGLLFILYYGYIVLIAVNRPLLSRSFGGATTIGIPLGAAVIVVSWILTAIYIAWANRRFDADADRLRERVRKA